MVDVYYAYDLHATLGLIKFVSNSCQPVITKFPYGT